MDWLGLLLVTPVILATVVLLAGFTGCGVLLGVSEEDPPPPSVTNLVVKALDEDGVMLTWVASVADADRFDILRAEQNQALAALPNSAAAIATFFPDAPGAGGSKAGITFVYQVRAMSAANVQLALSNEGRATLLPLAPALTVTPVDVDELLLEWSSSPNADRYVLQHRPLGGSFADLPTGGATSSFTHGSLVPASDHEYQSLAVVDNGFDENIQKDIFSKPSDIARARPLAFKTTLTEGPQDLAGYCLIQRIAAGDIKGHGSKVKITVAGTLADALTIDRIYVSQVVSNTYPTWNPWDSAADITKVLDVDSGDPAMSLGPATMMSAQTFGPIDYTIPDPPQDLLIAFDIRATGGQGNVQSVPTPGSVHYYRAATSGQAKVQNRYPDPANPGLTFTQGTDRHYLVQQIEVS